jgi:6-pyruvoyltetrahydropterin/6-carboxytetrahydropterin synthase
MGEKNGVFEAMVEVSFSASHMIKGYPGNCAKLHGHNFKVRVYIRSRELNELGLVIDFRVLKRKTEEMLSELDHTLINEHPDFEDINPSSENIARWLFKKLSKEINSPRYHLHAVEVWESDASRVRYWEGG